MVVLTIDPARRLAQSMGLTGLDNTPRPVKGVDTTAGGELHAMMLDMKRTFDEIVARACDAGTRRRRSSTNPFYQSLSSSFSGTQEYMAMEKLGQLRAEDRWDLIVVDTPPSRSALDFLDAPAAAGLVPRRALHPAADGAGASTGGRAYLKVLGAGFGAVTGLLTKILGGAGAQGHADVRRRPGHDVRRLPRARRHDVPLLQAPGTAFVVVAAPERDALREASYFVERLGEEGMPLAGLVLNRVHSGGARRCRRSAPWPARRRWTRPASTRSRPALLRLHAERARRAHPRAAPAREVHRGAPTGGGGGRARARRGRARPRRAAEIGAALASCATSPPGTRCRAGRASNSARAVSSRWCHEVTFGRRRSSARRSRSVMPPQTPNSTRLSSASDRHSVRTGQPMQTALARFCAAPCTNSSSGSLVLQAPREAQSSAQVIAFSASRWWC